MFFLSSLLHHVLEITSSWLSQLFFCSWRPESCSYHGVSQAYGWHTKPDNDKCPIILILSWLFKHWELLPPSYLKESLKLRISKTLLLISNVPTNNSSLVSTGWNSTNISWTLANIFFEKNYVPGVVLRNSHPYI